MNRPDPSQPTSAGPRALVGIAWTIGYQGRRVGTVLEVLQATGIEVVLDVREHARSRSPGFAGDELGRRLGDRKIRYQPFPELGCPADARREFWKQGAIEKFRNRYDRQIETHSEAWQRALAITSTSRCVFLCMERDPGRCHRRFLTERLRARGMHVHHF